MDRKFKRTAILILKINVYNITFNQFDVSLLNKSYIYIYKNLTDPRLLNIVYLSKLYE